VMLSCPRRLLRKAGDRQQYAEPDHQGAFLHFVILRASGVEINPIVKRTVSSYAKGDSSFPVNGVFSVSSQ